MFFNMLHVLTTSYKYQFKRHFVPDIKMNDIEDMIDVFARQHVYKDEQNSFTEMIQQIHSKCQFSLRMQIKQF